MKKTLLLLLTVLLPVVASAYDACIDGIYYNFSGSLATVTNNGKQGTYTRSEVTIPESVTHDGKTYIVTSIGNEAFYGAVFMKKVNLPSSIISIGADAFSYCQSLTSVFIPNNTTSIGEDAFMECAKLKQVVIPSSVTSIGYWAFSRCKSLESVFCLSTKVPNVPIGNTNIFQQSSYETATLYVPSSAISSYGDRQPWESFGSIKPLEQGAISVDGVKYKPDWTNNTAKVVGKDEDANTVNILASINVSGYMFDVNSIDKRSFKDCTDITSVTIPTGITSIGDYAFQSCTGLTSVTIPGSVTDIGQYVFRDCTGLTSATISEGITNLNRYLFFGCTGLTKITLPEGVTSTGVGTFMNCSKLNDVTFPSTLQTIENYAFSGCRLSEISIPEGVTSILYRAFYDCEHLWLIFLPSTLNIIEGGVFDKCNNVSQVYARMETPPEITENTFSNRTNSSLKVPFLSEDAYKETNYWKEFKSFTTYSIIVDDIAYNPNRATHTASVAKKEPVYTGSVNIPPSIVIQGVTYDVTGINSTAFWTGYDLTSVNIPNSVTSIGISAFQYCSNLISVNIPSGVTTIERETFRECSSLPFIELPSGITSIGKEAFRNCTGLREIRCNAAEPPEVCDDTFRDIDVSKILLIVPDDAYEKYKAHEVWGQFWIETPTGIVSPLGETEEGAGIYNLAGQRLDKMQKGINIIGGRKVLK